MKKQSTKLAVQKSVVVKLSFNILDMINTYLGDGDGNGGGGTATMTPTA
jgi:hypothetical protein